MIQIFNRSQYEDVLITRVHKWIDDETAYKRMEAINNFEMLLQEHNQTIILKFYLHMSREKQQERLNERLTNPKKFWKANPDDFKEAELWDDYMKVYEECFEKCNLTPWTIVPADQNWYKEYTIATTLLETLKKLDMKYPEVKKE
jgi:polyphosphate kinase 2 (PPK2 family)